MTREELEFPEQVLEAFSYVADSWGFHVARATPTFVRFERGPTFIHVFHGRSSYEIGVEVGLKGDGSDRLYPLPIIMEVYDESVAAAYQRPAVIERGAVGRALGRIASLFRQYGREVATDVGGIWMRLDAAYDANLGRLARGIKCRQCRTAAEEAFRRREYEAVVERSLFGNGI